MSDTTADAPLWVPAPASAAHSNIVRFAEHAGVAPTSYESLYAWSIEAPQEFWPAVWRFCEIIADERPGRDPWDQVLIGGDRVAPPDTDEGPHWFRGARLNFAENLLRFDDDREALVEWNEQGRQGSMTYAELQDAVACFAIGLRNHGVTVGDRVAGYMPNIAETVIAMLATTSIGAIWSSCSPDFGVNGVLDRFGQIRPRILVVAEGYVYNGRHIDCVDRVREVAASIPEIERVVVVSYPNRNDTLVQSSIPRSIPWWMFAAPTPPGSRRRTHRPEFARLAFDHPAYIMYSSGTTGLPKCMVHGAGGTLLQHLKELVLHTDLTRNDRIFYFTTCGWMMWNWLVSSLAVGATVVLYDGAPMVRHGKILWDMAAAERVTVFGTSAKWLALVDKEGVKPRRTHNLSSLKSILSTGSPLAAHSFDYVYRDVKSDVRLSSISGGTDIISCFALGVPTRPVWRGELQGRGLGMKVEIFDDSGKPLHGEAGELVCTAPFPSMPVAFWNDPTGEKYRAAYFERFPNAWRHGDWAELTEHDGVIIYGRSDATLNPGGVRIGTAEIYRQVEQLPEVVESIAVGQEVGDEDVRIVLFVRLRPGLVLDDPLREEIRQRIRDNASPHHVPKRIIQVADIPRTISGKITELAVREIIHGRPVKNVEALANPEALELYRDLPELRV